MSTFDFQLRKHDGEQIWMREGDFRVESQLNNGKQFR